MRAAVLSKARCITIEERPRPVAGPGEVVVAVSHCGICGSDVHGYLHGILVRPGTVMGHECVGTIAQVGADVRLWSIGDRVVVKPMPECGSCYYCRRGEFSLCSKVFQQGIGFVPGADGGFADFVKIVQPDKMLFRLPDEIGFEEAVLIEPLATSLHAVRLSSFRTGDSAVVLGAGTIGLGVIQFLGMGGGARKIIVVEPSAGKRKLAQQFKAHVTLDPVKEGDHLKKKVLDHTDGLGADLVFECAGVSKSLQASYRLVKKGGQVLLVGVNEKDVTIRPFVLSVREIQLKGIFGYYDEFPMVIELLRQKRLDVVAMLSDMVSLENIEDAGFLRLSRELDLVKLAVRMEL